MGSHLDPALERVRAARPAPTSSPTSEDAPVSRSGERYLRTAGHEAARVIARLSTSDASDITSLRAAPPVVTADRTAGTSIRRGQGSSRNKRRDDEEEEVDLHAPAEPLTRAEAMANLPAIDGPLDEAVVLELAEALNLPGMIARIREDVIDSLLANPAIPAYKVKELLRKDDDELPEAIERFIANEKGDGGQAWMTPASIQRFREAVLRRDQRTATAIIHGLDVTLTGERACENIADVIGGFLPGFTVYQHTVEHFFLRKGNIIVDGSWKQFLDTKRAADWNDEPTVFVGTIEQLEALLGRYISSKSYRRKVLAYYRQGVPKQ